MEIRRPQEQKGEKDSHRRRNREKQQKIETEKV
jgi:hypothetical protein